MMYFNFQNNPRWKNDGMQIESDKIGKYGCLISTISNIVQTLKGYIFNPHMMNDLCKKKNWYFISDGLTSYLKTDEALKYFGLKRYADITKATFHFYDFVYAYVVMGGVGHFINVINIINDKFVCYDVFSGGLCIYEDKEIIRLTGIKKI